MTTEEIDKSFASIWDKGYEVKVTSTEVRVFKTEYCEFLDLDQYNTLVRIPHSGNVMNALELALSNALQLLGN